MTFLPNKIMRYTAALRNYIQYSVIKYGIEQKHLRFLRRIIITEALYSQNISVPCNINYALKNILLAIKIIKKEKNYDFNYEIKVNSNCIMDIKLLKLIILNICANSDNIIINNTKGMLIIKVDGKIEKYSRLLAKKLDGCIFYEIKTDNSFVVIPFIGTDKISCKKDFKTVSEFILDPLSLVNIFIN